MRSQTFDTTRLAIVLVISMVPAASCTRAMFVPPAGPGQAAPDAPAAWAEATSACRDVRSYSALLTLSGRVAGRGFPGITVNAAMTSDGAAHLLAHYSGRQIFLLAGRADRAWLWLREDHRLVVEPMQEIVDALVGVRLGGDDLLAVLTGCAVRRFDVADARTYGDIIAIRTPDGRAFLSRPAVTWRVRAAELDGFTVDYRRDDPGLPGEAVLRTAAGRDPAASLRFRAEQIETNEDLAPQLFVLPAGASGAAPMTLEELRNSGPLRGRLP